MLLSWRTTVETPFCPPGSLVHADDCEQGELSGSACAILMKDLWLARLSRPDIQKPICDLASHVQSWTRNDDKKLHRLMCYMNSSVHYKLICKVNDKPEDLKLLLFVDADLSSELDDARSTSGGFLVLAGPNTWFPLAWLSKRQTSTSRSTTEAEVVALAASLFSEALPTMSLWDTLLGRPIDLIVLEDNQATIKIIRNGYSSKLRHVNRVHKINLSSVYERFEGDNVDIVYCNTDFQAADIFTKALAPNKWDHALKLLGMDTTLPSVANTKVVVADTRVDDALRRVIRSSKLTTSWSRLATYPATRFQGG